MKQTSLIIVAGILLVGVIVGAMVVYLIGQQTPTEDPVPASANVADPDQSLVFPELVGTSLLLDQVRVPSELSGELKLLVVSYDDSQQPDVDEWLPALEDLNEEFPQLAGYYIPLLPKSAADSSIFIIGGMAAVAKSDVDRARTIVVFTNVEALNQLVNVLDKDTIQLFLLDQNQRVLWHGSGIYDENTREALRTAIEAAV